MDAIELTEDQRRVYQTLAELETPDHGIREDELARATQLDRAAVSTALRSLVSSHDLVRELPPEEPDLGPRYRVKDSAASA